MREKMCLRNDRNMRSKTKKNERVSTDSYEQGYGMKWRLALNMIRGNDKEEFGWGESKCEVN